MTLYKFNEWKQLNESKGNLSKKRKHLIELLIEKNPKRYSEHSTHPQRIWIKEPITETDIENDLKNTVINNDEFKDIEIGNFNLVPPKEIGQNKSKPYSGSLSTIEFTLNNELFALTYNPQKGTGAPTTEEHESASIYFIEQTLKSGERSIGKFIREVRDKEIFARIEQFSDWLETFQSQVNNMYDFFDEKNVKDFRNYEFFRESQFTKKLYKHAKDLVGFKQKDNWQPADVWIVKNPNEKINEILKIDNAHDLNNYLRDGIENRELIPLSLKKTSKTVSLEERNMEDQMDKIHDEPTDINMDLNFNFNKNGFDRKGALITTNLGIVYEFRTFGPKQWGVQSLMKGKTARGSKVTLSTVRKYLDADLNLVDEMKSFDEKKISFLFDELNKLAKKLPYLNTKVSEGQKEDFIKGMKILYDDKGTRYSYADKAMSMEAVYNLLKGGEENTSRILKIFYLTGQKIGPEVGPYIIIH